MTTPVPQVISPRRCREHSRLEMKRLKIGRPDWDKLQPPHGFPPLKTVDHPASEWNKDLWPPSGWPEDKLIAKGKAESEYLVKGADLDDLVFLRQHKWKYESKRYRIVEIQRRAWEKYGGPTGLAAEKADKQAKHAVKYTGTPAQPRGTNRGRGRGRARGIRGVRSRRGTAREAVPTVLRNDLEEADIVGVSTPSPSTISATQSLSPPPSLMALTGSVTSRGQTHDSPPPPSMVSVLNNSAALPVAFPPRHEKRWRESEAGVSTSAKAKRPKLFHQIADSDNNPSLRNSPPVYQREITFTGVVDIGVKDDDPIDSRHRLSTLNPRKKSLKKKSVSVPNVEVIDISD